MAQNSSLCSRCRNPIFKPRIGVNFADLYAKLRSEFGPSVFAPRQYEATVLQCDRDLEDYESESVRLQSQLVYIEAQKKRLRNYKAKLQSLSSLIRRLPNETLAYIFGFTCGENLFVQNTQSELGADSEFDYDDSGLNALPALSISSVCIRWRLLALSSPAFWANLHLRILKDSAPDRLKLTIQLYLQRSRDLPLSLQLYVHEQLNETTSLKLVTILFQHAHRWKSFKYSGSSALTRFEPFLHSVHFPILRKISLSVSQNSKLILKFFQHAPNLCELNTNHLIPNLIPQLAQLTSLKIPASFHKARSILYLCPNLTALRLYQLYQRGEYSTKSVAPQRSGKLRSFSLNSDCQMDANFIETVFISHTFPFLQELHLVQSSRGDIEFGDFLWPRHAFNAFMSRSSCTITSFSITGLPITDSALISALHLLPSLREFLINDIILLDNQSPITPDLISALHSSGLDEQSSSASSLPLLPKLRYLTLETGQTDFDDAAFVSMVSSRWLPDSDYAVVVGIDCLRSVVLHLHEREVDQDVYKPLYYLEKAGMRVVLKGEPDDGSDQDLD